MPSERIPFINQQATGLDEIAGAGREAMNVIVDSAGSVRRRPGISLWSTSTVDSRGLDTIHVTVNGDVFALSASPPLRQLYKVTPTGSAEVAGVDLVGTLRPVIAETESILVFAAGDDMVKMTFSPEETTLLGGSPPKASHVVAQSSRLAANDVVTDKTKVRYSGPALGSSFSGFENWGITNGAGFFTAEARPDPVIALHENTNEIFVFGTTSIQLWAPDATGVFSSVATREHGIGATHSIVRIEQSFGYLDHRRRIVVTDGRATEVISGPIQRELDEMETVEDCFGFRVTIGPTDAVVWTFPSSGRSFVYQKGSGWGQWQGWDDTTTNWEPLNAIAAAHNPITNETLVALQDGRVGVFETGATTDLGVRIVARVTTGFGNHKTDRLKHCSRVRLAMKRGEIAGPEGPQAWLTYRDRPGDNWNANRMPVDLGRSTDTDIVVEFPSLGTYRRRQWRFEFSGTEDLVLTEASEDFDVLGD